jgi:hypothetical protein
MCGVQKVKGKEVVESLETVYCAEKKKSNVFANPKKPEVFFWPGGKKKHLKHGS